MPKTRFKRFLSMVLTLCMVLTMIAPVFAANDPVSIVSFTINGESKTLSGGPNTYLDTSYEIKNSSYTGDWVAYFDKDTGSLTLKNYNNNGNIVGVGSGGAKDFKVILEGDNYINNGSLTNSSGGDITITSDNAAGLTIKKHDNSTNPIVGIHTVFNGDKPNITISGKTNITIDVENSFSGKAQGIYARGDVKIKDNASLNIKARNTGATNGHLTSGIFSEEGSIEINTSGDLMIDTRGASGESFSYALYAVWNNHTLTKVNSMVLQWTEGGNQGASHNKDINYNESDYYIHTENNKQAVSYFKKQVGKYFAKIEGGSGTNIYSQGETVTIKADEAKENYIFDSWKTKANVTFTDQKASHTTFTMPEEDIEIEATYTIFDKQPEFTKTGDNSGLITWSTLKATTDKIYIEKKIEGETWSTWQLLEGDKLGSGDKSYEVDNYFSNGTYRLSVQPEGDAWLTSHEFEINWDGIGQPTYSVTVNDGSTNTPNPKEGDIVTITANPAPDGKEFDKWTSEDGINFTNEADIMTTFTMPGKDITVNASYKDIDLSMTDTNLTNLTASYYNGSHIYTDLTPKFDSQESNYSLDLSAETQNTSFYLYTKEGQTVSASVDGSSLSVFEANESDPYNYSTNSINMDKAIKIVTLTVTAKDGKTTKDYTITINWAGTPISTYSLSYDGNGSTSGTVPTDNKAYTSGQEVTVLDDGNMVKTNYIFDGWNTKADATGNDYKPEDKFNITEDITLYAKWLPVVEKIEIKNPPNMVEYADLENLDLTGLEVILTYADKSTKDVGHNDFATNNLITSFAHGEPLYKTESQTLNIHWEKDNEVYINIADFKVYYRITFDAQEGTVSPASALTKGNSEGIILGEGNLPTPTRDEHTFNGWFSQSTGGDKIEADTQFSENTTIYAQWTKDIIPPENYTVTVQDDSNGTGTASPSTAVAGTEINLTATANTGYKFKEWEVISGGVTITSNKFTMPSEDVVIKAIFEKMDIPVDKATLTAAITSANTNKNTAVVSTDGTDVDPSDKWVTQAEMDAYETAISTAQALADKTDASQTDVDNAVAALNTATNTFNNAKKAGTKVTIEITGVTISPKSTTVEKGKTTTFSAIVMGTGSYDKTVTWSVYGNNDTNTTINSSGLLTVDVGETAASITVTATSNGDSNFSDDATVTVSDIPVTTYTVTVNNGTGGGTHAVGATVSITAGSPPAGQEFDRWVSSDVNFANENNPTTTFEMPASDVEVTATYKDLPVTEYTVTVQDDGNGVGGANPSTAVAGTEINLTATANTGYKFKEWQVISGGVTITSNKFTMPDNDVVVKAVFEKEEITPPLTKYTVTVQDDGNGTGTANPTTAVAGTEINLTATANTGYKFKEWQVISGGVTITSDKFTMPDNNVVVKAIFEKEEITPPVTTYTVTINGSYASTTGGGKYAKDTTVTIHAGSRSNYSFNGWTSSDGISFANANSATTSFTMPDKPVTIIANWSYTGGGGSSGGSSSGGSTSPTKPTIPTADGTVKVEYSTSNGTASLLISNTKANEIIAKAKNREAVLDLESVKNITGVNIPKNALSSFEKADLDLVVKLPEGTATIDNEALASILDQSTGTADMKIELKEVTTNSLSLVQKESVRKDDLVFDINILMGGKKITEFDGKLTINVPYDGELPVAVWYLNHKGELEKLESRYRNGLVSFTLNHLSLYVVGKDKIEEEIELETKWINPFTDVQENSWFYEAVKYVYENDLMKGTGDNLFSPNEATTRGMIVTILYRLEGLPLAKQRSFADVKADKYYANAVAWAAENKIVNGYGNDKFGPEDPITREQLAAILMNYAKYKGYDVSAKADLGKYEDSKGISNWARDAMSWANAEGLIQGDGNKLIPTGNATRAQVAAILSRFVDKIIK